MIDRRLHRQIDRFLLGEATAAWLTGRFMRVFLRKTCRWLAQHDPADRAEWLQHRVDCIDLANISGLLPQDQLQGIFPGLLDHLESKQSAIFVECVHPKQLHWYFERRSYLWLPGPKPRCYYRLPAADDCVC